MTISESIMPELEQEMATTRKTLERVPDAQLGWKPHQKSMSMGQLAAHLAGLPGWALATVQQDSLDLNPTDGPKFEPPAIRSAKDLLVDFDRDLAAARDALSAISNEEWMEPWTLLDGGKELLSMPRIAVMRSFVLNHNIHHRAQLGVYLRMNDVAVPGAYGPSADEMEAMAAGGK